METSFGRGMVYDLFENNILADVYYFIQGTLPFCTVREFHGFLDPILEYENLAESFKKSSQARLLLDNGRRLLINTVSPQVNQTLPIFFSGKIETEQAETHKEVRSQA